MKLARSLRGTIETVPSAEAVGAVLALFIILFGSYAIAKTSGITLKQKSESEANLEAVENTINSLLKSGHDISVYKGFPMTLEKEYVIVGFDKSYKKTQALTISKCFGNAPDSYVFRPAECPSYASCLCLYKGKPELKKEAQASKGLVKCAKFSDVEHIYSREAIKYLDKPWTAKDPDLAARPIQNLGGARSAPGMPTFDYGYLVFFGEPLTLECSPSSGREIVSHTPWGWRDAKVKEGPENIYIEKNRHEGTTDLLIVLMSPKMVAEEVEARYKSIISS